MNKDPQYANACENLFTIKVTGRANTSKVSLSLFVLVVRVFLFVCFLVVRKLNERSSMKIISSPRHFEVFLNSHSFFENLIEKFTLQISISTVNYSRDTTSLI